uniref:Putative salivary secreted protein n=1 Tax=Oncopeltus fasciatus TaxID=7536 RepID=A3FK38_ONCFA|nr:putative salivary secreted protein precursor [Oncopeltus fasciatus]
MMFRFFLLVALCLVAGSQAHPQPLVRGVLRGVGEVVRTAEHIVGAVGEGVGEVVGAVGESVGSIVGGVAGDRYSRYYPRESPATSLASAAESLQEIARNSNSQPEITIQQIQSSDVE